MSTHDDAAGLPDLGELQGLLLATETLDEFLRELTARAVGDPTRELSCGVTVRTSRHRPYTLGSSSEIATRLDESQYSAGDGPCLYALHQAVPVRLDTMAEAADRWPGFHRQATTEGLVASFSVPMNADHTGHRGEPVGALNLYARGHGLTDEDHRRAHAFADRVAGAVTLAARLSEQDRVTTDLQAALTSRTTIDQALGILMGQHHCTAEHAFTLLRQDSQHRNITLRDIAAELVTHVSGQQPQPGPAAT